MDWDGILSEIEFSTSAVTGTFWGTTRRRTDSFGAFCRPPVLEIFMSVVERARLSFDAASAVMKEVWDPESSKFETSRSFQLCHLCQPLLLAEALTDHWTLHRSSHHPAAGLGDRSVMMHDVSSCKYGSWTSMNNHPQNPSPDNSCTVWASSALPFSHACPTAGSDNTVRLHGTHCIPPSDNFRSAQQLKSRLLDAPS